MMNNTTNEPGRLEALLPWYAKGSLSAAEMREVEAYLAVNPEARRMLALIEEELAATIAANESLGAPDASVRSRLMAAIAADAAAGGGGGAVSFWQRVRAIWAGFVPEGISPGYALGGALAAVIIMVQAAAITVIVSGQGASRGGLELASGRPSLTGTFVLVSFTDSAKATDITALLKPLGAQIVDGPKSGGVFKLRIADKVLPEGERAAIIAKLRERSDIVSFVSPAG